MSQRYLGSGDGSRLRIHNFDFEFSGESRRQQQNDARENLREPHALLLFTRKGFGVDGSRRSPGLASHDIECANAP